MTRRLKKYEVQHGLICSQCKDEIYSNHRHDNRSCKCGETFIDGGFDYCRYGGSIGGSITRELPVEMKIEQLARHTVKRPNETFPRKSVRAILKTRDDLDAEEQLDRWKEYQNHPERGGCFKFKYQYNQFKITLMLIEEQLTTSLVSDSSYIRALAEYIKVNK